MKKILFVLAIAALVISVSSCGNKKKKADAGTHTHEDGTVHADDAHNHDATAKPNQEAFEIKANDDAEHKHETGDGDSHNHDGEHTHDDGTVHADHK